MRSSILCLFSLFMLFCSCFPHGKFEMRDTTAMKWYKGNVHTHAREGESDSSVESIVTWYRDNGYQFLVITDHSVITVPSEPAAANDTSFLLIPGEEIIGHGKGDDLEINGLNMHQAILPLHDDTVSGALQKLIDAVRLQNGVPVINHPNFKWMFDQNTLLGSMNCNLFELYNGYPGANNQGDAEHPGTEQVWDFLLSCGKRIYGVATDDAHIYQKFSPELSNPGRGWVVVKASRLDAQEIMHNLDTGLFYSSTGVEILDFVIKPDRIQIMIREKDDSECATDFIGSDGKLLHSTKNNPAVYCLTSEKKYVRAKITAADGSCAWMQPVFVRR